VLRWLSRHSVGPSVADSAGPHIQPTSGSLLARLARLQRLKLHQK